MAFSPNEFMANAKAHDGFAKNNRFEVMLPIPTYVNSFIGNSILEKMINSATSALNGFVSDITSAFMGDKAAGGDSSVGGISSNPAMSRYLALQCESAELPGRTLQTTDVKIYGPTFKVPYMSQYNDVNLNFICTNEFFERKLFERWMDCINPTDTNNLRFAKDNETRYLTNIKIIQYDEFIKQIYAVELIDAFPVGVAPMPLGWQEDGFHRMSVHFAYQKYKVIYDGSYNLADAAVSIFGGSAANKLLDKGSQLFGNTIGGAIGKTFPRILF